MQMAADVRAVCNGVDKLARGVLGMARHKPDAVIAGNSVQHAQQRGKGDVFRQALAVGVHILAQQSDVLVALGHKLPELPQNIRAGTAALSSAHIRHDTVRTEIIAAVHDGKPGAERGIPPDGHILYDLAALGRHAQHAFARGQLFTQDVGQRIDAVDAEHNVHERIVLFEFFHDLLLLGHASGYRDQQLGVRLFQALKRADVAENALLGVLAHRAGVEHDQVRVLGPCGQAEADIR